MKVIWKGSISFGLVSIDVELYSAVKSHSLGFKLLHGVCKTPVTYERWCSTCAREIAWSEIVKGFKLHDDSYFVITPENLKKLKPEKTDTIDIKEVVDKDAIEPLYYDQHYYVTPTKATNKAFFLFLMALAELEKVAIGTFVLKDKEHVCALMPYKNGLLLTTLNYAYEVQKLAKLEELQPPKAINKQELQLAEELLNKLSSKKFDITKYKDTFVEKLRSAIEQAAKGIVIREKKKKEEKAPEASLMAALKESLSRYEQPKQPRKARA